MSKPTFQEARKNILDFLQFIGWKVARDLKVPHATNPEGTIRYWFKAQAVYVNDLGKDVRDFSNTHSTWVDIREVTPEQFLDRAKPLDLTD